MNARQPKQTELPLADGKRRLVVCTGSELIGVIARLNAEGYRVMSANVKGSSYTLTLRKKKLN
jgi:hypothetical protein